MNDMVADFKINPKLTQEKYDEYIQKKHESCKILKDPNSQ